MFPSADEWPHNTSRCPHGRQPASPGRPWDVADDLPDAPLAERVSHLYECEQLSTYQVAQIAGIDRQRVGRMLRAAGVAVKPRGAGRKRQADSRADVVAELYLRQELTSTEVSARTGIPSRTIRGWLAARQAPMRTRGWANREDRLAAPAGELSELYVDGGLSAAETGRRLGIPLRVVLRSAHDLGLPVRTGGGSPSHASMEIKLVEALYADALVRRVLDRHGIRPVPPGGPIWERFPSRLSVGPRLAAELYVGCGLGLRHIELLTGVPAETLRGQLTGQGIPLRHPGGRSPFLRRWHCRTPRQRPADPAVSPSGSSTASTRSP
jgi:hypothetical protein